MKRTVAPVLLLQGRQDLSGEANVCEAHLLIRNSTLTFIDKCGHMPWLEQPEQTWKIVDDFLAHLPGRKFQPIAREIRKEGNASIGVPAFVRS